MTQDLIETFLTILKCRNITAAAQQLYTSQSTVSHRLRLLEDEVGASLFVRQKGHRMVELTPAGEEFVELAERWMSLFRDMGRLETGAARHTLVVGAPDLVNSHTFAPLYRHLLLEHPEMRPVIRTYHSGELYRLIEARAIDVGYVYSQRRFPDVVATPLYHEPMYVLCHRDSTYHPALAPDELPAEQEVYLRWSSDFGLWHDRFWPSGRNLVTVGAGGQISLYLDVPGRWALAPASVYQALRERGQLSCSALNEDPPSLCCYEIRHRYPRMSVEALVEVFSREVRAFVRTNDALHAL